MTYATHLANFEADDVTLEDHACEFAVSWERVGEYGQPDTWEASARLAEVPFGLSAMKRAQVVTYFGEEAVIAAETSAAEFFTEEGRG